MSFSLLATFMVALALLLGGCSLAQNAAVAGVVEDARIAADGTAATLDAATCGKTVGSYFRLTDPRHKVGTQLLCDSNAQLPTDAPASLFSVEQLKAIADMIRATEQ